MKLKSYLYILMSISLWMISCQEDYLERFPLDNPSDETFLTNEAELEMAVTGAYNSLWYHPSGVEVPFFVTLDYASDIGWDRNTSALQALGLGQADANNGYTAETWTHFYRGIARCNSILVKAENIESIVPEKTYKQLLAETRFLRAYYYFYLNELYGGVPLIKRPQTLSESQTPRVSKAAITDFIISELDEIEPMLLAETKTANKGRVNRATALALKSRVALYNERWEEAADAAKDLMDMGSYQLHNDFVELFSYDGENSSEIIFSIQYKRGVRMHPLSAQFYSRLAKGFSNKIPVQSMVDSYECIDGLSIDKSPLFDPKDPFVNRDPRLNHTIVLPQTKFLDYMFETHPDSIMTWDYSTNPETRVSNTDVTNAYATFSGYLWRKYADIKDKSDPINSELNIITFRLAEVLLNYAEAKIELNQLDQSVYDAINVIRQRPSVEMPPIKAGKTQAELRSIIRKERKYELAAEGLRLFDIRRWKIAHEVVPGKLLGRVRDAFLTNAPRIDANGTPHYNNVGNAADMRVIETRVYNRDRDYLWPIPRLETEVNTSLEQNPNY